MPASATFTVDTPLPIEVNCPADLTVDACLDSLAIDALFRDWLNGFSVDGGCVYDSTRLDTLIAPDSCGGSITVNFMASDSCAGDASCSATFTVDTPLPIEVNCPADLTVDACLDSLAIDALFRDWLNGFSVDGGCVYDSTRLDTLIAPDSCGGSITVNFMASDSCAGDASCSATFTVDTPLPIEVNCPADLTVDACLDSLAIDALFRDWLNGFSVDGGCVYDSTRLDTLIAPDSCGGSITVNFMASDSCAGDASCSATFTVDTPLPIEVNCPADLTVDACLDSLAIDALFRDWLNGFSVDGGCVYDSTRLDTLIAPDSCGGSITVNFMASDSCAGDASCSATFTVDAPLPIEVNCPADLTVDACLDSLAIDALFRDWLNGFSVDGGCVYDSTRLDTLIAPDSCGGSITVNFMASDSCAASCSATFTVDTPLPISTARLTSPSMLAWLWPSMPSLEIGSMAFLSTVVVSTTPPD